MESEADFGDGLLSSEVGHRRRSTSFSDDYSVQKTNDDAAESKFVAVQQKYYSDNFIGAFIHSAQHRDPEIVRGYWARTAAITSIVSQFIKSSGSSAQIINLGAGFDTLYWRLKETGHTFNKFVEFDFSSVTAKKIRQIQRSKTVNLCSYFSESAVETQHSDLHCGDYHLLGADLRQIREFIQKLETAKLDNSLPTLIIAECLFVYMDQQHSQNIIEELAKYFKTIAFINYEQVNMNDNFSKIMLDNLNNRGIHLPGLVVCESLSTQKQRFFCFKFFKILFFRFSTVGFQTVNAWTINRIEMLEPLDERELLTQLLEHYCLIYAFKNSTKNWEHLANLIVETVSKNEQQQQHLLNKKAWDMALQPLKSLPMNMFMMYMAGNTISIFPIMMVMMMAWRPIKAILSVNTTFKVLEQEYGSSLILHKIVFSLGNLAAIALAVYKCHTMGLLPNHESDWLDFMSEPERLQISLSSDIV
ncbi:Leucine carboxyl methyltransferase 1 [Meloidogyne graminicola]|uniref:ER membrane protein complex subunit 4 n=1 Tax=Meloidogyne graminicola TaxID=189291 RepID=A0A8S9ZYY7_9BILA|nr:Leucine carboxyl methyltransferase 1 [Meloidogyne graminicola]